MKAAFVIAAAAVGLVAAQDPLASILQQIPDCAVTCVTDTKCADAACFCSVETIGTLGACVLDACGVDQVIALSELQGEFCPGSADAGASASASGAESTVVPTETSTDEEEQATETDEPTETDEETPTNTSANDEETETPGAASRGAVGILAVVAGLAAAL